MKKLYTNFVFLMVSAALLLALGIVLLPPVTDLGQTILPVIIAVLLVLYLVFSLFDRLMRSRGTVRVLTLVEFCVVALLAVGLVFVQVFNARSVSEIIGVVIWLRGCTEAFRGYLIHTPEGRRRFPLAMFALSIAMITVGAMFFFKQPLRDEVVILALAILTILAALALALYALLVIRRPHGKSHAKTKAKAKK